MKKLLTVKEVSAILNIDVKTLYAYTAANKIPFIRIHGCIRFDEVALNNWLDSLASTQGNGGESAHQ